jgi:hypothetical protein
LPVRDPALINCFGKEKVPLPPGRVTLTAEKMSFDDEGTWEDLFTSGRIEFRAQREDGRRRMWTPHQDHVRREAHSRCPVGTVRS